MSDTPARTPAGLSIFFPAYNDAGTIASLALVVGILSLLGAAEGCVDGVTPDCEDAAAQCGPSIDGGASATPDAPYASDDGGRDA